MYGMGAQGGILFKAVLNDFGMETIVFAQKRLLFIHSLLLFTP